MKTIGSVLENLNMFDYPVFEYPILEVFFSRVDPVSIPKGLLGITREYHGNGGGPDFSNFREQKT